MVDAHAYPKLSLDLFVQGKNRGPVSSKLNVLKFSVFNLRVGAQRKMNSAGIEICMLGKDILKTSVQNFYRCGNYLWAKLQNMSKLCVM